MTNGEAFHISHNGPMLRTTRWCEIKTTRYISHVDQMPPYTNRNTNDTFQNLYHKNFHGTAHMVSQRPNNWTSQHQYQITSCDPHHMTSQDPNHKTPRKRKSKTHKYGGIHGICILVKNAYASNCSIVAEFMSESVLWHYVSKSVLRYQ